MIARRITEYAKIHLGHSLDSTMNHVKIINKLDQVRGLFNADLKKRQDGIFAALLQYDY